MQCSNPQSLHSQPEAFFPHLWTCLWTTNSEHSYRRVLDLVKELVGLRLPNLHICVTSRPAEVDIKDAIEPLAWHPVSLHSKSGQKEDISKYVRSVVYSDSGTAMSRWSVEEKELDIDTLSDKADGMFRWVYCQLEVLQNCLPNRVRQKLIELPKTLDETHERILKEIGKADGDLARRILHCLAVASRPLFVDELAEVLTLDFEDTKGRIPKFNENLRLQDRQQASMITCSSLITIVDHWGSDPPVLQFSHFSVKEFLTSGRLATPVRDISNFHVLPETAHTILAQACLAVLLRLDDSSSLAEYAARHWVGHAQFEKVSLRVGDGMRCLFNQSEPYFVAWLKLYDIDLDIDIDAYHPWPDGSRPRAAPLYYASLCGFRDLVEHLIVKNPQDVNARGGRHHSPLAAALRNRHFHVAELLHQHGAVMELASYNNRTLLVDGCVDSVKWLLDRGASINLQQNDGWVSSPDVTMQFGYRAIMNAAIKHGVSPLHLAHNSLETMQLLIQRGADVTARNNNNLTPLHLASARGRTKSMELLIQHGADVNARDKENSTPLHLAMTDDFVWLGFMKKTRVEAVEVLLQCGADVNARNNSNSTPLHLASSLWGTTSMERLIQHGADVNASDKDNSTPLHLVAMHRSTSISFDLTGETGFEAAGMLLQHGAEVNVRNNADLTPLDLVSPRGETEFMELLIENGADVNSRDKEHFTSLHKASFCGQAEAMLLLIRHGADVNAKDRRGNSTPLHSVMSCDFDSLGSKGVEAVKVLLRHGADVNARHRSDVSTPLDLALSRRGQNEIVDLLLKYGANTNPVYDTGPSLYEIALSTSRSISQKVARWIFGP